jgi:hypothetical protein
MSQLEYKQSIFKILKNLKGIEPLKELFWSELNYDRINESLSRKHRHELGVCCNTDFCLLFYFGIRSHCIEAFCSHIEIDSGCCILAFKFSLPFWYMSALMLTIVHMVYKINIQPPILTNRKKRRFTKEQSAHLNCPRPSFLSELQDLCERGL